MIIINKYIPFDVEYMNDDDDGMAANNDDDDV